MVMPLTILFMVALLGLTVRFFSDLREQAASHEAERDALYETQETDLLRLREGLRPHEGDESG